MEPRPIRSVTTPPSRRQFVRFAAACGPAAALALAGCDPRSALYFLQPFEPQIAPPCAGLKDKTVVLLVHAAASAQNDYVPIDQEIASRLTRIFKEKVKKVEMVDATKVRAWVEAHPNVTDPGDAARAFDADIAIQVDILEFHIDSPTSPDLYAGHASVNLKAVELKHPETTRGKPDTEQPKEVSVLHEADVQTDFPRVQGSLPSEVSVSRTTFRKRFLDIVAAEISWNFVPHTSGDNVQSVRFGE